MVNYLYRLSEIEANHEAYRGEGRVAASSDDPQPVASRMNISQRSRHVACNPVQPLFRALTMLDYVGESGCGKNAGPRAAMAAPTAAAGVAELADALDLGSSDANRGGSKSPRPHQGAAHAGNELVIIGSV